MNKKHLPKAQTISCHLSLQHVRDGSFIAISSFAGIGMDRGRSGSGIRLSGIGVVVLMMAVA
jgi:hypothetical protein